MSKKFLFVVIFLLSLVSISFAEGLLSVQVEEYVKEGLQAQKIGQLEKAIGFYQKAILIQSNNIELKKVIFNNMGVIYILLRDFEKAKSMLGEVLAVDHTYQPARYNLGLIYDLEPDKEKARSYWEDVFRDLKPKDFVVAEPPVKAKE